MPKLQRPCVCVCVRLFVCACVCVCGCGERETSHTITPYPSLLVKQVQVRVDQYTDPAALRHQETRAALYVEAELLGHGCALGQPQRTSFAQLQPEGRGFRWHSILTFPQKVGCDRRVLVHARLHKTSSKPGDGPVLSTLHISA